MAPKQAPQETRIQTVFWSRLQIVERLGPQRMGPEEWQSFNFWLDGLDSLVTEDGVVLYAIRTMSSQSSR